MFIGVFISSKMNILAASLLLLLQMRVIFGSEFFLQYCGYDHIAYSLPLGEDAFYINGKIVDRNFFCKAFQFYLANSCNYDSNFGRDICGSELSYVDFLLKTRRKLLEMGSLDEPASNGHINIQKPAATQKVIITASGILLLFCACLCPCLHKKMKATDHTILPKDSISSPSSSVDMNSVSVKISASPLRVPPSPSRFSMSPQLSRLKSVHLNLNQVARATLNFSSSLQIGEGGYGNVYRAHLEDGNTVAIKRAKREHYENWQREFITEVELLAKIDHRNLVKLLGYVETDHEQLIIMEYVPNGTLREHLDGKRGRILDFNQKLEIAIDIAHALTYLHQYAEKPIIHRDVNSSNILLTESMRAKVANFGFAKLGPTESERSYISTNVKGTVGYLDPEYMKTFKLTTKSDVYSFGILLLEILTGRHPLDLRRPVEERVTVRWAFEKYHDGRVLDLVDPMMEQPLNQKILSKMFELAFQCAAPIRADRPDMKSVGERLWAIRANLKGPKEVDGIRE